MKVLHIINAMSVAGAETLLANSLAPGGLPDRTENMLLYFKHDSVLCEKIDPRVQIINLHYKGWYKLPGLFRGIRKAIKDFAPDIIHTHLNPSGWYTSLICPSNIPHVHTMHISYSDNTDTRKVLLYLERKLMLERNNVDFITLSPLLKEDLLASVKIRGEVYVLSNFIDDVFFQPHPATPVVPGKFRIIAIGNIRPQKNYDYLLEIFSHLRDTGIEADVYGFGDHSALSRQAAAQQIPVTFKGPAADSNDLYWRYDAFIMPSRFEGFGLTAYEAMASGTPVILSDLGAFKSLIGDHALYIPLGDAKKSADIIREAAKNKALLAERALGARTYAEKTVRRKSYVDALYKIYEDVIQRRRPIQR